jgi:predicted TIM-barrel fold metal-dependent hydrolase
LSPGCFHILSRVRLTRSHPVDTFRRTDKPNPQELHMTSKAGYRIIALEEHYFDPEIAARFSEKQGFAGTPIRDRLDDVDDRRIREMDEAGIDVQVLSQGAPSVQGLDPETAVALAKAANDRLEETIQRHPGRYAGFTALPTPDPKGAADELERCVTKYGFKGGMVHGLTGGEFIDVPKFWPIFERADQLGVPIYLHPSMPHPDVIKAYYADYVEKYPGILTAGWGFTVETATQGVRMVLSGVFDEYPDLQVIIGHLGEGLPFLLWRISESISRGGDNSAFRDTFKEHVHITTSGNFSDPAMICSMMEMGTDRIMFSIDYPFVMNTPAVDWMENISLSPDDKKKLFATNAEKLLKM